MGPWQLPVVEQRQQNAGLGGHGSIGVERPFRCAKPQQVIQAHLETCTHEQRHQFAPDNAVRRRAMHQHQRRACAMDAGGDTLAVDQGVAIQQRFLTPHQMSFCLQNLQAKARLDMTPVTFFLFSIQLLS